MTLVDADLAAPALAVRLGIPPRPDLADAVDHVHANGSPPREMLTQVGRLHVLPGSHRPGEPPLRPEPVFDVIDALRTMNTVVVDVGPWPNGDDVLKASTTAVVVIDSGPIGIVRAATMLAEWAGPPPSIVLNRVRRGSEDDTLTAVRRWIGLDPIALIQASGGIRRSAIGGEAPGGRLLAALTKAEIR